MLSADTAWPSPPYNDRSCENLLQLPAGSGLHLTRSSLICWQPSIQEPGGSESEFEILAVHARAWARGFAAHPCRWCAFLSPA